jgi:hypothetical protein
MTVNIIKWFVIGLIIFAIIIIALFPVCTCALVIEPGVKFKNGDTFYTVQKTMNVKGISIDEYHFAFIYWNWDTTEDGSCSLLDLIYVSNHYGKIGEPGWIKEDTNADGLISIYDFVVVSNNWE